MAKKKQRWITLFVLAAAGAGGWWAWQRYFTHTSGTEQLVNQLWIERVPRDQRDLVHHFVLVERDGRRVGVTGRSSRWRTRMDLFVWSLEANQLRARFPQDDRRVSFSARTWRCAGEAPRPFELCLELTRDGRNTRLYSRKDWIIRPGGIEADPAATSWVAPALGAMDRAPAGPADRVGDGPDTAGWDPFE